VHVFVCALQAPGIDQSVLNEELFAVAEEFGLDRRSGWQTASPSGRVLAAGVHHSADVARARSYVHLAERSATWFDGLPVATVQIAFDERDAAQLDRNWQALPEGLEGQFSAIRLDLERDRAEVLLDPLGLVPVFVAQTADGGHLLSNSLVLLTRLLGAYQPDPCGVSTFVAIGWAADRRTLIDGISVLRGGAVHRIGDGRVDSTAHFGPGVLAQRPRGSGDAREVAEQMAAMMGSACRGFDLVQCALTGGRDSRLLLALLLEAGVDVQYYTIGERGDPDIDIAVEVARKMELDYYLTTVDEINPGIDWSDAADSFLARVDGLASLDQLRDHLELTEPLSRLDLKLWGVGGEMGRAGTGNLVPLASNVPLLRHSTGYQHRLLAAKARDEGLLTPAGRSLVDGSIRDFLAKRQEEGWMSYELGESFYVFERTGCWGMTGPRRTAVTADLFSAFITRPFLDYAFSMKTGARYVEVPHYSLMSALSPKLRDMPYLSAWHPQHPRLAGAMAAQQFAITLWRRLHAAEALSTEGSEKRVEAEGSFVNGWLESRLELVRDVCLQDSGPWDLIDRRRLEALLTGAPEERLASWYSLVRAVSVCWFLNRTLTLQSAHPPQVAVRS
jgi:hypothetical protein